MSCTPLQAKDEWAGDENLTIHHLHLMPLSFAPAPKPRRRHGIEDPELLARAAKMLRAGHSVYRVARQLGVSQSTLWRYTREGRLPASLGALDGREPRFEAASAVSGGGVLTALPALLRAGLLRHSGRLSLPKGFYSLPSLLLLWALLLLGRVRSPERLRYQQPGEWGALLGLDRCPCPRTLRRRTRQLAARSGIASSSRSIRYSELGITNRRPGLIHIIDDPRVKSRIADTTSIGAGRKSDVVFGYQALVGMESSSERGRDAGDQIPLDDARQVRSRGRIPRGRESRGER